MNVILSIKPIYAWRIISGVKQFEYRKKIWSDDVEWVYIYAGRPTKQIIGRFKFGGFIRGDKFSIYLKTCDKSGINNLDYFDYFAGVDEAIAIIIGEVEQFPVPIDPYIEFADYRAIQSFQYLTSEREDMILKNQSIF